MNIKGIVASSGIAIGKPYFISELQSCLDDTVRHSFRQDNFRYDEAILLAKSQLLQMEEKLSDKLKAEDKQIFDSHIQILEDPEIRRQTFELYQNTQVSLEVAYQTVMNHFAKSMSELQDALFREKSADVKDVMNRVLRILTNCSDTTTDSLKEKVILVTHECTPSMLASFAPGMLLGIVAKTGGYTSHASILARSMKIPFLFHVDSMDEICSSRSIFILDGTKGEIIVHPTPNEITNYGEKIVEIQQNEELLKPYLTSSGKTKDGVSVPVLANVSHRIDVDEAKNANAEGIGLYRSEYLFLNQDRLPSEEEQLEAYKHALTSFPNQIVVIRTFDVGGDKIPYAFQTKKEDNPFLGNRGIRFSLTYPEMFRTQIRALLKSSVFGKLVILFPMISTIEEFRLAKQFVQEEAVLLQSRGTKIGQFQLGMMVEVPSAAMNMEVFAKEADYFSVGSNDLIQYLFAADRTNEKVAYLYQPYHPSIYQLIQSVIHEVHKQHKTVGLCGELASDPNAVRVLVGLGIDELSVSPALLSVIRKELSRNSMNDMKILANKVVALETPEEVLKLLNSRKVKN